METIKINVNVPAETLDNIIVSMAESGGSNYWAEIDWSETPTTVKRDGCDCPATNKWHWAQCELMRGNGHLTVKDLEDGKTYTVTLAKLIDGLGKLQEAGALVALNSIIEDDTDADTADALLQCAIFGKLIYG